MALTQAQTTDLLNAFIGQYAGHKADYYGFEGECLSLAKRWVDALRNGHLNGPMAAPPAHAWGSDYWALPPQQISELFERQGYNANATYPAGSLFVNTASHHIGMLIDNHPGLDYITAFHQNANPDGSSAHTSSRNKANVDGILVLRVTPDAPPPPVQKYTIIENYPQGKQIRLNKDTNLWGMNYDFNTMVKQPVESHAAGEIWTVTNKVHHQDGMDYYRRDGQVDGFNVADCDDYTPPPPPAPPKPPAPPVMVERAETYDVVTKLMVFPTATDAKALSNYTGTDLDPGNYFVFNKSDNAYNLSTNNVQNQNKWVRITDNVIKTPEPVQPTLPVDAPATTITLPTDPAPSVITDVVPTAPHIKPQYHWIRDDKLPTRLTSTNSVAIPIHDLDGVYPVQQFPPHRTEDYSMYSVINNQEFWLPDRTRLKGWMYGVDVAFLPEEQPAKPAKNYDIIDIFDNGLQGFIETSTKYFDGIKSAVTTVAPRLEPAKKRIQQSIDGFSKRSKK